MIIRNLKNVVYIYQETKIAESKVTSARELLTYTEHVRLTDPNKPYYGLSSDWHRLTLETISGAKFTILGREDFYVSTIMYAGIRDLHILSRFTGMNLIKESELLYMFEYYKSNPVVFNAFQSLALKYGISFKLLFELRKLYFKSIGLPCTMVPMNVFEKNEGYYRKFFK